MRVFVRASALIAVGLGVWGCGGSSYFNGDSGNPNTPTPSIPGPVTINVVAINGAQSFSPNPATLPAGQMVVWHNADSITHHVVLNDRSVDTGDQASWLPLALEVQFSPLAGTIVGTAHWRSTHAGDGCRTHVAQCDDDGRGRLPLNQSV